MRSTSYAHLASHNPEAALRLHGDGVAAPEVSSSVWRGVRFGLAITALSGVVLALGWAVLS